MLKEILEVSGIVIGLVLSVIAVIKYFGAVKTAKEFSADLGKVYERMREVENKVEKTITDCQGGHSGFDAELRAHLKDSKIHRDPELEALRYETIGYQFNELKKDLKESIVKTETTLCQRIASLEDAVRNGKK